MLYLRHKSDRNCSSFIWYQVASSDATNIQASIGELITYSKYGQTVHRSGLLTNKEGAKQRKRPPAKHLCYCLASIII